MQLPLMSMLSVNKVTSPQSPVSCYFGRNKSVPPKSSTESATCDFSRTWAVGVPPASRKQFALCLSVTTTDRVNSGRHVPELAESRTGCVACGQPCQEKSHVVVAPRPDTPVGCGAFGRSRLSHGIITVARGNKVRRMTREGKGYSPAIYFLSAANRCRCDL